jgi:hypothetical protein
MPERAISVLVIEIIIVSVEFTSTNTVSGIDVNAWHVRPHLCQVG